MFDLHGKTALVTGSTQGIGLAIAKTLHEAGAKVILHGATSAEKCRKAAQAIGADLPFVVKNLSDPDCADVIYKETGDVDILVLNASVQYKRLWNAYSTEEYDNQLDCNLRSSYLMICKFAEGMKAKGHGRIITIGSVNQYNEHPELSLYGVTKAAQFKLVENIAPSLAPYGVTINNVAPGAIETPRNDEALADPAFRRKVEASIPVGRIGSPDDISPVVLLLASDEGSYITGADIKVDGGMSL